MPRRSTWSRIEALESTIKSLTEVKQAGSHRCSTWSEFAQSVHIRSGGHIVRFQPYDFQTDLIHTISQHRNTIILKSRQMGISETLCCYLLWRSLKEPGFTAVVVSKTQLDSSDLALRIRNMALSLGRSCPSMSSESRLEIAFEGLGRIKFLPGTPRAARGIPSVSVLLFDEGAWIEGIEAIYQAAAPTQAMVSDCKVIFNSTPNGRSGLFYETWVDSDFAKVELHYSKHPIYGLDPDWSVKTRQLQQLTEAQFQQEYELNFIDSQTNVFPEDLVRQAECGCYSEPDLSHRYIIGIDPAFGGSDYFVTTVWDTTATPYSLVTMFRQNRVSNEYCIEQSKRMIWRYSPYIVSVESNSGGSIICEQLTKLARGFRIEDVVTTRASKIRNINRLVLLLERGHLVFPKNHPLATEMLNFRRDERGGLAAAAGKTDDIISSAMVAFSDIELPGVFRTDATAIWSH